MNAGRQVTAGVTELYICGMSATDYEVPSASSSQLVEYQSAGGEKESRPIVRSITS